MDEIGRNADEMTNNNATINRCLLTADNNIVRDPTWTLYGTLFC